MITRDPMTHFPATAASRIWWRRSLWILAGALLLLAIALPPERVVDALSPRYRTVAGFRADFVRGLQVVRAALAFAALSAALLPLLLARARLTRAPRTEGGADRTDLAAGAALFLTAALAALPGLVQSYQDDEWRVVEQYIRHGPAVILTRNQGDSQILHSLLVWPFVKLFGTGEVAVRLPVWLGGALGAPLLLLLLRRRGLSRSTAVPAALLFALSPFLLQYLHESRAYALLPPCVFGLFLLQPALLRGEARAWLGSVALAFAAVGLHLFAAPAVAALFLAPLAAAEHRRSEPLCRLASALLTAGALGFLLYAPVLPQFLATASDQVADRVESLGPVDILGRLFVAPLPSWTAVPFLALLAAGLRRSTTWTVPVALGMAVAVELGLLTAVSSEIAPRFFAPCLAIAWVAMGDALGRLAPSRAGLAAAALVLLALTGAADVEYYRRGNRDYRGAAAELARRRSPGESVAGRFDARPLGAYLSPPPLIAGDALLQERAADWLVLVDINLPRRPEFAAWVGQRYEERFRLPSLRGAIVVLHRR